MKKAVRNVPEWVRDAIFYQIFPDRFANGTKSNDPKDVRKWGSAPDGEGRMGGDLAGVDKHLDYLRDLGINSIYFNPIFASRSSHGYDTTDYYKIDPRFGTAAQFKKLLADVHKDGWHVILDGVFNHLGTESEPFKSLLKDGEKSPYKDWFYVKSFPISFEDGQDTYETWNGTKWLPKLNLDNPETRQYVLEVAEHWIKEQQIDGWRLDAANEINHPFWKEFRKKVKAANPEAYLVGEIWDNAADWLQGDEFDAVMNYRWRGATYTFFTTNEMSPTDFDNTLRQMREDYAPELTCAMLNMLSSHDADRLKTRCKDNPLVVGQCVLFQFAYPGVPCIYYGDEIGMEGAKDPENRGAMIWDEAQWDTGLRDFHKRLIALRREKAVLRRGDFKPVLIHDENRLYGFQRSHETQSVLALFNLSDAHQCARIPLADIGDAPYYDWLRTGIELERDGDKALIGLPPHGMALLGRE